MKISREKASDNRARMVTTAARLFRERGFDGLSVADLAAACGFTHGGFYNHFGSKSELAAEATSEAFRGRADNPIYAARLKRALRIYLATSHRDTVADGCPAVALVGDAARAPDPVKAAFADGVEDMVRWFDTALAEETSLDDSARRTAALNLVAKLVGAVALARATPAGHPLSEEILAACLAGCVAEIDRLAAAKGQDSRTPLA